LVKGGEMEGRLPLLTKEGIGEVVARGNRKRLFKKSMG